MQVMLTNAKMQRQKPGLYIQTNGFLIICSYRLKFYRTIKGLSLLTLAGSWNDMCSNTLKQIYNNGVKVFMRLDQGKIILVQTPDQKAMLFIGPNGYHLKFKNLADQLAWERRLISRVRFSPPKFSLCNTPSTFLGMLNESIFRATSYKMCNMHVT